MVSGISHNVYATCVQARLISQLYKWIFENPASFFSLLISVLALLIASLSYQNDRRVANLTEQTIRGKPEIIWQDSLPFPTVERSPHELVVLCRKEFKVYNSGGADALATWFAYTAQGSAFAVFDDKGVELPNYKYPLYFANSNTLLSQPGSQKIGTFLPNMPFLESARVWIGKPPSAQKVVNDYLGWGRHMLPSMTPKQYRALLDKDLERVAGPSPLTFEESELHLDLWSAVSFNQTEKGLEEEDIEMENADEDVSFKLPSKKISDLTVDFLLVVGSPYFIQNHVPISSLTLNFKYWLGFADTDPLPVTSSCGTERFWASRTEDPPSDVLFPAIP